MFPFFIKYQENKLKQYSAAVANEYRPLQNNAAVKVRGVSKAIADSNYAYAVYLLHTRNTVAKILSIIPGTNRFQKRIEAAKAIDATFNMVRLQDRAIKEFKKSQLSPKKSPYLSLRRTQSNTDLASVPSTPINYASPIKRSISANNSPFTSPAKVHNPVTLTSPKFTLR